MGTKIVQFLLKRLLSMAMDALKVWFTKEQKKSKSRKQVDAERDKLKQVIDEAYDGTPLTEEQQKRLIDAARDLATNY